MLLPDNPAPPTTSLRNQHGMMLPWDPGTSTPIPATQGAVVPHAYSWPSLALSLSL